MPKRTARSESAYEAEVKDFLENVISTEEAAELLGTTPDHVALLIRREKIVGRKLGPRSAVAYKPSVIRYRDRRSGKGRPPSRKPSGAPS